MKQSMSECCKEWVEDEVKDDIEDNLAIAECAIEGINKRFEILIPTPEACLAFFGVVFDSIKDYVEKKKEKTGKYVLNISDHLAFAIDDGSTVADDMEEPGTFAFTLYHGNQPDTTVINTGDYENNSIEKCVKWLSDNIQEEKEALREISANAIMRLKEELNLRLGDEVLIFPLFVAIYDRMISWMTVEAKNQRELNELDDQKTIRFAGRMDVTVMTDPELVKLKPTVSDKLKTKNDDAAKKRMALLDRD